MPDLCPENIEYSRVLSALLLMLMCASNKRRNGCTESLLEDQSVCPSTSPSLSTVMPSCNGIDWSLKVAMIPFIPRASCPFHFCQQRFLFVAVPPMRKCGTDTDTIHLFIRKAWVCARWAEGITTCFLSHGDSMGLVWELILFKRAASPDRIMSHSSWGESAHTHNLGGEKGIFGRTHKGRSEKQLRQDNWAGSWPHKLLEALISPQQWRWLALSLTFRCGTWCSNGNH